MTVFRRRLSYFAACLGKRFDKGGVEVGKEGHVGILLERFERREVSRMVLHLRDQQPF